MKVLFIFIDMIRPNRLSIFNNKIKFDTPLDESLRKIGGTCFTNCFSQGPDTPRGMATFASGIVPSKNGCDSRVKWPKYFLKNELETIYDLFIKKDYKLSIFSNPNERDLGLFPDNISNLKVHNRDLDLDKFLSNIKLAKDHFIFISLPDFHWSLDDNSYTSYGEKKAYKDVKKSFDLIFRNFDKDEFDHTFVFSDHGFKFIHEVRNEPKYLLLNEDRTNILMVHRKKGEENVFLNNKLCSIADIFPTLKEILAKDVTEGMSLMSQNERDYVVIEDHLDFLPDVNQNLGIWAIVKRNFIYLRTLESGYILDRNTRKIKIVVDHMFDNILERESQFKQYTKEYKQLSEYKNILSNYSTYMHGGKRKKIPLLGKYLFTLKDFFLEKFFK